MSIEENKAIMREFYEEFWNKGNIDAADKLVTPDVFVQDLPADWPPGRARRGATTRCTR